MLQSIVGGGKSLAQLCLDHLFRRHGWARLIRACARARARALSILIVIVFLNQSSHWDHREDEIKKPGKHKIYLNLSDRDMSDETRAGVGSLRLS